jgi:hypothetical protein
MDKVMGLMSFKYPEKIWDKMMADFEKTAEGMSESDERFYRDLFHPVITLKSEIPPLNTFIESSIKNEALKPDFIDLIANFEDYEIYKRFLASILIYNRINNLDDGIDKFLYLCIAVEAAMHFKSNPITEKNKRFRHFFKDNLSTESKLKMISCFRNKKVKNIIKGPDLANHKSFGVKIEKTKSNIFLPSCYRQKGCFVYGSKCYPERICDLNSNGEEKINEQLDFILGYLYDKRSRFVHEGVGFSLESKKEKDYFGGGLLDSFYDPTKDKRVQIFFTLYAEDLFNFYEEALLNYFKG